jgi:hypothetical protein
LLPSDVSGIAGPALAIGTGVGLPFASATVLPAVGDLQNATNIDGAILRNVGNLRSGDPASVLAALTDILETIIGDLSSADPAIITDTVGGIDPTVLASEGPKALEGIVAALGGVSVPTL